VNDPKILIVDDEVGMLEICEETLQQIGPADVRTASDGAGARDLIRSGNFDLIITDIRMPGLNGIELLREARKHDPELPILMMTAYPNVETAVECMKLGAADYLAKPFMEEDLVAAATRLLEQRRLREENRTLRRQVERPYAFDELVGDSPLMRLVFDRIDRIARADDDVLVIGETGTGKELAARSIHRRCKRSEGRFVPVDCGAIPESLIESELFGHERGAFTGAQARSVGLLEFADGGIFFLDEVAELPLSLQAKLLRALQERRVRRVGGKSEIELDVRIVAASNRDLKREVDEGRFREDLYFRLNVLRLELPPLRDRGEDVLLLADHFSARASGESAEGVEGIDEEAREILLRYAWPGNVRELLNVIRQALALSDRKLIGAQDLPDEVVISAGENRESSAPSFFHLRDQRVRAFEKEYFTGLLLKHGGDVSAAAREAVLPRGTFYRILAKHQIRPEGFRTSRASD
jgi:DNA-binding NtrC family response regulator